MCYHRFSIHYFVVAATTNVDDVNFDHEPVYTRMSIVKNVHGNKRTKEQYVQYTWCCNCFSFLSIDKSIYFADKNK